jgi:NAD+--dinitrogen-reductase ADP-D-ribosyltransferase
VSEATDGLWRLGNGSNLVGVPVGRLASAEFNDRCVPIHITGVQEMNRSLFAMLDRASDAAEAAEIFQEYMTAMFGLDPKRHADDRDGGAPRRYRSSYLRLLRGWAYDSNSPEGAVLKGWVESRFGLLPTFHVQPIVKVGCPAWVRYVEEKMASRFHNNAIQSQLDLLYEFVQWMLARPETGNRRHLQLYRGVHDFSEHQVVERIDRRTVILRLNNLISFTSDREVAEWFGDWILEAAVPVTKVLFCNWLLPRHALKGEGEVLAIGGDYRVKAHYV